MFAEPTRWLPRKGRGDGSSGSRLNLGGSSTAEQVPPPGGPHRRLPRRARASRWGAGLSNTGPSLAPSLVPSLDQTIRSLGDGGMIPSRHPSWRPTLACPTSTAITTRRWRNHPGTEPSSNHGMPNQRLLLHRPGLAHAVPPDATAPIPVPRLLPDGGGGGTRRRCTSAMCCRRVRTLAAGPRSGSPACSQPVSASTPAHRRRASRRIGHPGPGTALNSSIARVRLPAGSRRINSYALTQHRFNIQGKNRVLPAATGASGLRRPWRPRPRPHRRTSGDPAALCGPLTSVLLGGLLRMQPNRSRPKG
jgi:hypothetical protein